MKTIQEVVESSSSVDVDPDRVKIVMPEDFQMPAGGLHIRWPDPALDQEARLMDYKWYAALAYVRANKLNHNVIASRAGPFWHHRQRQGLQRHAPGAGMTWGWMTPPASAWASGCTRSTWSGRWRPPSPVTLPRACRKFWWWKKSARSSSTSSRKSCTTGAPTCAPPWWASLAMTTPTRAVASGAMPNPSGNWLLRAKADLSPALVAKAIAQRLKKLGVPDDVAARMDQYLAMLAAKERDAADGQDRHR